MEDDAKFCEVCGSELDHNPANSDFVPSDNRSIPTYSNGDMGINSGIGNVNQPEKASQGKWIKIVLVAVLFRTAKVFSIS